MPTSLQYSPVAPADITLHRESLELEDQEQLEHDDESETGLTSPTPPGPQPTPPYSKIFIADNQSLKLFWPQFWRWLGTVALVAFTIATLKIFQEPGYFSHYWKRIFNTIITGLTLGLGLNFFVSLSSCRS